MSTIDDLMTIPLLASLDRGELEQLAAVMTRRIVPKGSYILYANDPGTTLMFLAKGSVNVTLVGEDGKEVVISQFGAGEFFGELAIITGEGRSANVIATTDTTVYVLPKEDFDRLAGPKNGLMRVLLLELAKRLQSSTDKIGDLTLYDVYRRVGRTLHKVAIECQIDGETRRIIENRPTHQELASMVGTSREMVTRALKGLEEDKHIILDGKRIEVLSVPR